MEPDKNRTAKPLARPWGYASISAEKRQAREPTPDLDDERSTSTWWNQYDPQTNTVPDSARDNTQTYRPQKGDPALISGGAGYSSDSTLQTATKAPRLKSEANMNKHRCVSTAVPDNALRVSPQRTSTRGKNRPAHCQQCTALVDTPTEHKTTKTVPSLPP